MGVLQKKRPHRIIYVSAWIFLTVLLCSGQSVRAQQEEELFPVFSPAQTEADGNDRFQEQEEPVMEKELRIQERELRARTDRILESMSLYEKAAQLFIVTPEALTGVGQVTQAGDTTRIALEKRPVGGLIYMEPNIISGEQLAGMTSAIQSISQELTGLPLFLCVDEEGGEVRRISGRIGYVPALPDMWSVGQSFDPDMANAVGAKTGAFLAELGINVNFAPDADVVSDPASSSIGTRSFGSDPQMVGEMSAAYVRGLQKQGVCACLKHFPGHGAADEDSHISSVISYKTAGQLEEEDLVPFKAGIDAGASFIMAGHLSFPEITSDPVPASLSRYFLTELLREKMGYEGLIITDALNMGAVTGSYGSAKACVMALTAGADVLLMPADLDAALQGILAAVDDGTITGERIDESVRRILVLKLAISDQRKDGAER